MSWWLYFGLFLFGWAGLPRTSVRKVHYLELVVLACGSYLIAANLS